MLAATRMFRSQQAGFGALAILMSLGFIGLLFVRGGDRSSAPNTETSTA